MLPGSGFISYFIVIFGTHLITSRTMLKSDDSIDLLIYAICLSYKKKIKRLMMTMTTTIMMMNNDDNNGYDANV